ncbi:hypothetical protein NW752_008549 [Fusarium irregulare]|uniref:Uncharacterized protein n=1 Tax=Fusarium irregulare TaxID=2494466 RepID=A0A9W8UC27_9HYPO|nr:hypothetical protein NW752_008549 [Fusarium irregulare]KAJ4020479.1 hypothetical protein NW766_001966 [Fusarium irregulare]
MGSHESSRRNSGQHSETCGTKPEATTFITSESRPQQSKPPKVSPVHYWSWEIVSLLFALALLIATIAIPAHYNDKVLKRWPYDISLNTIIAILSTFMRASMMLVVAELVGQMGWQSLRNPRPVSDLYHFDNASRGILGAFKLLWNVPPRLASIIAAIVIILSPAIAPFSQQAVKTVPCSREVPGSASLPVSHHAPIVDTSYRSAIVARSVSSGMKATMLNGLVNPKGKDAEVQATCSSGNCTFTENSKGVTHASIAMCNSCLDTTEFIKLNVTKRDGYETNNYTLPNNQWVQPFTRDSLLSAYTGDVDWALGGVESEFAELTKAAIANLTVLTASQGACKNITRSGAECPEDKLTAHLPESYRNYNLVAITCALYPCMKEYHAQVKEGRLIEKVVDETPLSALEYSYISNNPTPSILNKGGRHAIQSPCLVGDEEYTFDDFSQRNEPPTGWSTVELDKTNYTVPDTCLYQMGTQYSLALSKHMDDEIFNTHCASAYLADSHASCGSKWWLGSLQNITYDALDTAFGDFTTAMTNNFRLEARSDEDKVTGVVNEMAICTVFDWRWVLLPAGLMAVTLALLIYAVVHSYTHKDMPVWKTSILPLLFYGPNITNDMTRETDLDGLQREAAKIKVEFQNDDGIRLRKMDTRATES